MSFLDQLGGAANGVADKSGDTMEIARLNSQIGEQRRKILDGRMAIGELYCRRFRAGEALEPDVEALCRGIASSEQAIENLLAQIREIHNRELVAGVIPVHTSPAPPPAASSSSSPASGPAPAYVQAAAPIQETEPSSPAVPPKPSPPISAPVTAMPRTASPDPALPAAGGELISCAACGVKNPRGTKFCKECGMNLEQPGSACPSCGALNPPGIKFCKECGDRIGGGAPQAAAPPPPGPEIHCPVCGTDNPPGIKFCGDCGSRL